jgi:peptide/nickel transport system substrate-binding protein
MKKAVWALVLAAVLVAGCGKSGTKPRTGTGAPEPPKPPEALASTESAPSPSADLGAKSLEGANPAAVVDSVITDGGTLVIRYRAEPDSLNPLTGRDLYGRNVLGLVMDGLVSRNLDTLEWEPRLAESWETSADHLTYTFHLRKDAKWDDGVPFTSEDVLYSYEKMIDPGVDAPQLRNYYIDLDSVTAPGPYTVVFKWKKPYFLSFEFSGGFTIVPKHVFDTGVDFNSHPAGRKPVGIGMFKFIKWETGQQIVLERNEDYFGRKPHVMKIVIRFIPDENSALLQASSLNIDEIEVTPEQWVNQLDTAVFHKNFNRYYYYDPNYRYIGWNEQRPFFADKRVRRAMTELVDREAFLKSVMYNLGKVVTGTFYVNSDDYSPEIKPWPFDPADARRLLDEAGWADHDGDGIRDRMIDGKTVKFAFNFMYPSGRALSEKLAILLQEELKKVGIEMNIQNLEWALFIEKLNSGDFDAVTLGWSLGIEQDPYQLWHSSQVGRGSNFISFKNGELDKIIEEARVEFDPAKRHALYHRFNEIVHDEQPYTFLFCDSALEIVNKRFHNVVMHKLGLDMRDWYVPPALQ